MSTLYISPSNPLRLIQYYDNDGVIADEGRQEYRLFKDWGSPFFDQPEYLKPYQNTDSLVLQIESDYESIVGSIRKHLDDSIVTDSIAPTTIETDASYHTFEPDISSLDDDTYYFHITGTDGDDEWRVRSEPFKLAALWPGTVLMSWYNNEPNFGVEYRTGLTFYSRLPGRFIKPADAYEAVPYDNDALEISLLSSSVLPGRELELFRVAAWEVAVINRALAHDSVTIGGHAIASGNKLPLDLGDFSFFASPKVRLGLKLGGHANTHDSGTRQIVLSPPTELAAALTESDEITLTWNDINSEETGYEIWRSTTSGSGFALLSTTAADAESFVDTGLTEGTTYYYKVRAIGTTNSVYTSEVSETTLVLFASTWNTANTSAGSSASDQIQIPTVSVGTYDFSIDFGDGTVHNNITDWDDSRLLHTYQAGGIYLVTIWGTFVGWQFNDTGDKLKITHISKWGCLNMSGFSSAFWGCSNLTITATDQPTGYPDASSLFRNCSSLTTIPNFGNWELSGSAQYMLRGCSNLNESSISDLDVSSISSMYRMLQNCTSFNRDLSSWDVSSVISMQEIFDGCTIFNGDVSTWETASVNNMESMFRDCSAFNQSLNTTGNIWNVSNVTNFSDIFRGCSSFNGDLVGWDITSAVGATSLDSMFYGCTVFNGNITGWDLSNATSMYLMLNRCDAFNRDISGWNVSNVTNMAGLFAESYSFNSDISGWNVSSVTNMNNMFKNATSFSVDVSGWNVSSATNMNGMFHGATSFDRDLGGWDIQSLDDATNMFNGVTLSTANYNALLIGWQANTHNDQVTFHGGNSEYTSGGAAETARTSLVGDLWTITDGGAA
ncbi:MAG: BspA family leucine-rich repeat surface protein [Cyclobacteriaceae bacterium]